MKNILAERMWVWFCGECGNSQLQPDSPKFNGEILTCTICGQDNNVAPVAPLKVESVEAVKTLAKEEAASPSGNPTDQSDAIIYHCNNCGVEINSNYGKTFSLCSKCMDK